LGVSLVPGGTYRLRVVVPDGRVVTGHTTSTLLTARIHGSNATRGALTILSVAS
jgi:hypothetical protein